MKLVFGHQFFGRDAERLIQIYTACASSFFILSHFSFTTKLSWPNAVCIELEFVISIIQGNDLDK